MSFSTGILSILIFLPCVFKERFIAEKELDALKKMADNQQSSDKQIMRRISRVVQPDTSGEVPGSLGSTSKQMNRRISRVAFQEIAQEEQQAGAEGDAVSRMEKVVRKFSTYVSADGSNVAMMDPDISK